MSFQKKNLRKVISRSARIFSLDLQELPTEASVAALEVAIKHWPDFVSLSFTGVNLSITLKDVPNKLGRPWSDDELMSRIVDLLTKLLVKQGDIEEA